MKQMKTSLIVLSLIGVLLTPVLFLVFAALARANALSDIPTVDSLSHHLAVVASVLLLLIVGVEFISPLFVRDANLTTAIVALSAFAIIYLSHDVTGLLLSQGIYRAEWTWLDPTRSCVQFAFLILGSIYAMRFAIRDFHIDALRTERRLSLVIQIALIGLFVGLSFTRMQWIAVLVSGHVAVFWMVFFCTYTISRKKWEAVHSFTLLIVAALYTIVFIDALSVSYRGIFDPILTSAALGVHISFCFFSIYLFFTIKTLRSSYQKEKLRLQLEQMQSSILRNQISSHFLFNTLSTVKSYYHVNQKEGDRALDLLSKFLRSYTEAEQTYLVPLEKELDLLSSYAELYRMKRPSFDLIFNVESFDYEVPYFSLQPLLENAIQHSGILQKEGGYVQIDSFEEGEDYVLVFRDNGHGFDVAEAKGHSVGLKNVRQRFELLLHASFDVTSTPGEGTTITIRIPKHKKGGTDDEDSRRGR